MALVHGYADGLMTITEETINAVIKTRAESSLFTSEDLDPNEQTEQTVPHSPVNEETIASIDKLGARISFLENMVKTQACQLQDLISARSTRDQLTLEIFRLLQHDIEKRWDLNARYLQLLKKFKSLNSSPTES